MAQFFDHTSDECVCNVIFRCTILAWSTNLQQGLVHMLYGVAPQYVWWRHEHHDCDWWWGNTNYVSKPRWSSFTMIWKRHLKRRFRASPLLLGLGRKSIDPMEAYFSASVGIVNNFLKLMVWLTLFKGGIELCGYSDADSVGDADTRQSTSGYFFLLGLGLTSWKSLKQNSVSIFSIEAKYRAY